MKSGGGGGVTCVDRLRRLAVGLLKTAGLLLALYMFICSLTFLSISFRILGGRNLSGLFSQSELLSNPIVGVMIGILVTVLVQSSATSTSIIVSLVSAGVEVRHAIPMILGSNVGTSVTNTIVSMTDAGDRERFRRAFAAATVHDMFNWLAVGALLVVELSTDFLERLTAHVVEDLHLDSNLTDPDLLKPLTEPFTDRVVLLDQEILMGWSLGDSSYDNVSSLILADCDGEPCTHLAALLGPNGLQLSDTLIGIALLVLSLLMLVSCLLGLMKLLNSMLGANMTALIQRTVDAKIPYVPWLTGYLIMVVGAVVTILVRSSSVFTSTLTPLCGAGLISLETVYPLTLGSNIGTTTTSIIAAFAAEGKYLKPSIQIAFVHLFFNLFGILFFYPIPWMRWPIGMARTLGDLTAQYRWFAGLYLVCMFFFFPLLIFLLSFAGLLVMYFVLGSLFGLLGVIFFVNFLQRKRPGWLPEFLRTWDFLPLWTRSLEPLDNLFYHMSCCKKFTHEDFVLASAAHASVPPAALAGKNLESSVEMHVLFNENVTDAGNTAYDKVERSKHKSADSSDSFMKI